MSYGNTQLAVLTLLKTNGPMQRWQISEAIGKKSNGTIQRLLDKGHIRQFDDINVHPNPTNKLERAIARYFAFVSDLKEPKGVSDSTLKWAERILRAAGYTVEPPKYR